MSRVHPAVETRLRRKGFSLEDAAAPFPDYDGRRHWSNLIPETLALAWDELALETRAALMTDAQQTIDDMDD